MTSNWPLTGALGVSAVALALWPGAASALTFPAACSGTTGDVASLVAGINQANVTAAADTVQRDPAAGHRPRAAATPIRSTSAWRRPAETQRTPR